jgi:hypothetical protein
VTTIAYRDGVMAADTRCTWADTTFEVDKLVRLPCGGVAGGCGKAASIQRGFKWLLSGCKGAVPKIGVDTFFLIAFGDGRVCLTTDKLMTMEPVNGVAAIGSGQQAAIGAMRRFKATAVEAVEAAATVDPYTGGEIDHMQVERPKARSRR